MELLTKRFILRDFLQDDAPDFEKYHADLRFLEFYGQEEMGRTGHARELIEVFTAWAAQRPRVNYQLAIIQCEVTQTLIGSCGLRCLGLNSGRAELGIELAPAYWGRYGYAIEILVALGEFGFRELGLEEIFGRTVSANLRVGSLTKWLGSTKAVHPSPAWMLAKGWHHIEWRLSKKEWENSCLANPRLRRWL